LKRRKAALWLLTDPFTCVRINFVELIQFIDWDDNLVYMATKKAYIIMAKDSGAILQSISHEKLSKQLIGPKNVLDAPIMSMSKTKCLILESNNQAIYFDETQGIKKQISFRVDPSRTIQMILMQEMYVIVIYENSAAVYNATTGDKLEERVYPDKQFKFKPSACVNFKGNEVYMIAQNNSSGKNVVQSEVH
jgi:hypothetical protein